MHSRDDALKVLLAGADAVMLASALLEHGPEHLRALEQGISEWMAEREYASIEQLKGSMSQGAVADPAAFERANYLRTLQWGKQAFRR